MPARRSERIRARREASDAPAARNETNSRLAIRLPRMRPPNAPARVSRVLRALSVPSGAPAGAPPRNRARAPPRATRRAPQRASPRAPPPPPPPADLPTNLEVEMVVLNSVPMSLPATVVPTRGDPIATARLQKEFMGFAKEATEGCKVELVDDNIFHWIATIPGPPDTPYEGGFFKLDLVFPTNYPFQPPHVEFLTRIFHCNITKLGYICLDILRENWSPALSVSKVLLSIMSLLADPNPSDPLEPDIADLYNWDLTQHNENARKWTNQYAKP
ncbi:ubiquitin-conjugating enzyme E2-17 kDa [Drosophila rhopaloa]|uniref:E2 ubiquitin-conjugating enzyme n=1 Tax=Drosophila rhopaloa TaxID=1041015 RepID=A0A6P4E8R2_DRORH|nr:ubiquitin-conjugating enzyme E2-17 kDa [Drosophila rhopaloa]